MENRLCRACAADFGVWPRFATHIFHPRHLHLDPDFDYLNKEIRRAAKQLRANLGAGDLLVFYAASLIIHAKALVYAIIWGSYVIENIMLATGLPVGCASH